ncbi:MAG TPA: cbb3-type cytochrome c oxidase subunit I [Candidatus Acidoferrum sp.]|nr:cbb3-type cytochrome c oxidase subunit I [Candidatus Acidoferrum sp.]
MNQTEKDYSAVDASCRVPLLALFGGAALWLVVGLALEIVASLTFHMPDLFACCQYLTYGRVLPAANDLIVYGFAIPAALGVILWIFARLSEAELVLPLVPIAAANIWHLGVFIGVVAILIGDSTGFAWLEFPRAASVLLFAAFMLIAISAFATFGERRERALQPPHWFLLAALLWFPWIYSTANLFLVGFPVRGVTQAVIDWWFSNNLLFVWLGLVGLGVAFYVLPKLAGRPLQGGYFGIFGFWTFILFAPWLGIPQTAPVPSWLPAISVVASVLMIFPLLAFYIVYHKTVQGVDLQCKGGPFCYTKFGTVTFILSGIMLLCCGCPDFGRVVGLTWFVPAQACLQIFGFFSIVICGAVYELLPRVMGFELSFPKLARFQHWLFMAGVALLVVPLAIGGILQGLKMANPSVQFSDIVQGTLPYLRISTLGLLLLLLGSLLFAANIFGMTARWTLALLKTSATAMKSAMQVQEVKS